MDGDLDAGASLRLLDLGSAWLLRAGGTQAVCSGDRARAREWARSIHAGLGGEVDGLTWPSSILGGGRCVVLWESAEDSMPTNPDLNLALADPGLGGPSERSPAARLWIDLRRTG